MAGILVIAVLAVLLDISSASHVISAQATSVSGSDVSLNIDIVLRGDNINLLSIWNANANTYECRTDGGQADDIFFDTTNTDTAIKRVKVILTPTQFQNENGINAGCSFSYPVNGNYEFYIRTFVNNPENPSPGTDKEFHLSISPELGTTIDAGSISFTGTGEPTALTADSIISTIEVVDGSNAVQTSMQLGDLAKLKLTLTVTPYIAKTSVAGAVVHSCVADDENTFTSPMTFIGSDGCFTETALFDHIVTNGGFSKDSSSISGATRTFLAYSSSFEMSSFHVAAVGQSGSLYVRCGLTFCYDDSATSAGTCGGVHCDPDRRKRREVKDTPHAVMTNITLTSRPVEQGRRGRKVRCDETDIFRATTATLGTIALLGFGAMFYTYSSMTAILKAQLQKRHLAGGQ